MNGHTASTTNRPQSAQPPRQHTAYHESDGPARLSTTLIHVLADVAGADVSQVHEAIASCVDVDALDRIFASNRGERPSQRGQLSFPVWQFYVTVYGDGRIVVEEPIGPP